MIEKGTEAIVNVGHYRNQCLAVAAAYILFFSQGSAFGFISPILTLWKSDETPLTTGPMSSEDVSWVVSIGSIGSLCSIFIFHKIVQLIGSKTTMTYCLAILSFIVWSLFAFGRTKYEILIARFIAGGIGGGVDTAVLLYVSEIADDRIRGALGSASGLVRNMGGLVSAIVATFADYSLIGLSFIWLPIVFVAIFGFLPNTAPHLIRAKKHEEAKKAIRFYKGYSKDSVATKAALASEYDRLVAVAERRVDETDSITWKKLCRPVVYRGLIMGVILCFLNQYAGGFTLVSYSVLIFQEANTKLDPYLSSIALISLQAIGTLSSATLVDTLGRKILVIVSLAGCSLGMAVMATYMYLREIGYELTEFDWIPVVSLGFVIFISSTGITSLTFICILESMPTDVRGFGLAVGIMAINIFAFTSSKLFPILMTSMRLHGVMAMYAGICAFGTIFTSIMLNETKGKNLDEIGVDS